MLAHGADVAARNRPGQRRFAGAERAVKGGLKEGREVGARSLDPEGLQHPHRLGDEGDEVVCAVGEGRVIEAPVFLCDDDRRAARLGHERLADGQQRGGGGDGEGAADEAGDVERGSGEGHGRMDGEGKGPRACRRFEHGYAVAARDVDRQLPGGEAAELGQAFDERAEFVVGNGEKQHLGPAGDLLDAQGGDSGQHGAEAVQARLGGRVGADDRMPGGAQGAAESASDAPG